MIDALLGKKEDPPLTCGQKAKHIFVAHWRGILIILVPLLMSFVVLPNPEMRHAWCGYALLIMAAFWVSECVALPVTSFIPLFLFPLSNVMNAKDTAKCYFNDTILMFLGSLMLAASVEQSGLHNRMALCAVRSIGYSHYKLLLAMCSVTTFVSMWITNTAATTMVVPIIFALLKVFEEEGLLSMYERDKDGNQVASPITVCYFCSATFSATIGGIGTLVGTGTNLVFRGLFLETCTNATDYLSFAYFSGFAIPYMIVMEIFIYLWLIFKYFGFLRPKSDAAKTSYISPAGIKAAKAAVEDKWKALGPMTYWEFLVVILFMLAMVLFFSRSPVIFKGWGDRIQEYYTLTNKGPVKDSCCALLVVFFMMFLPYKCSIFKHFTAKCRNALSQRTVARWLQSYKDGRVQAEDLPREGRPTSTARLDAIDNIKEALRATHNLVYEQLSEHIDKEDIPKKPIRGLLDWTLMDASMPYSFTFLLGGGFCLSTAANKDNTNLNQRIGAVLKNLEVLPNEAIVLILLVFTVFVTNFASNVAVINVIGPMAMTTAKSVNQNPLLYIIVTGFSASYTFLLPVGTPGNLIVQMAAKIPTPAMVVAGSMPSITTIIITYAAVMLWAPVIWPVLKTPVHPDWNCEAIEATTKGGETTAASEAPPEAAPAAF